MPIDCLAQGNQAGAEQINLMRQRTFGILQNARLIRRANLCILPGVTNHRTDKRLCSQRPPAFSHTRETQILEQARRIQPLGPPRRYETIRFGAKLLPNTRGNDSRWFSQATSYPGNYFGHSTFFTEQPTLISRRI
jgi:hypothetical protein